MTRSRKYTVLAALAAVVVAAVVVLVLVARGGPPSVSFASVAGTLRAGPAQYCDVHVTHCENHPDAVVSMPVPAGQPLRVSVPDGISATPWQVVFVYRPKTGQPVSGRSPVFAPGQQTSYTLTLPEAADQLVTAQVQQYGGGSPVPDAQGGMTFPIRGSWVLQVP